MILSSFLLTLLLKKNIACSNVSDTISGSSTDKRSYVVNSITFKGNKITKESILLREITFKQGDTLQGYVLAEKIGKSKLNLLNTALFNFVEIATDTSGVKINVTYTFTERWYIFPVPTFVIEERNFNTWLDSKNLSRATYGFDITHENFRGRKEALSIKLRLGYTRLYGLAYSIPYLNAKQTYGLSFSIAGSRNHETAYASRANLLRYYKDSANFSRREFAARIGFTYRKGIHFSHYVEARYYQGHIADTVTVLGSEYPYYTKNLSSMQFMSLSYLFRCDYRDFKYYPLKGFYIDCSIAQMGLDLLKNENLNVSFVEGTLKKYFSICPRLYAAASIKGKISANSFQPYSVQRAFGYGNYVRGYEYYVVDGDNYFLAKTGLKYQIVKQHIKQLPWVKMEQFRTFHYSVYANVFSDIGYAKNSVSYLSNNLCNTWLSSAGVGIDFVTYYDGVFRIDYSFNRRGEYGFFLHLVAPI